MWHIDGKTSHITHKPTLWVPNLLLLVRAVQMGLSMALLAFLENARQILHACSCFTCHLNKFSAFNPLWASQHQKIFHHWINCHMWCSSIRQIFLLTRSYFKPLGPLMRSVLNCAVNLYFQTTLLILLRLHLDRDTANAAFCCQWGNILKIYLFPQGCEGS